MLKHSIVVPIGRWSGGQTNVVAFVGSSCATLRARTSPDMFVQVGHLFVEVMVHGNIGISGTIDAIHVVVKVGTVVVVVVDALDK